KQHCHRQQVAHTGRPSADAACPLAGPGRCPCRRTALASQRPFAGGGQLRHGTAIEIAGTLIECQGDFSREFVFPGIHSSIPCFLSSSAKACVAREQCVFTLPSEHPMAFAASATSSSSQ